MKPRFFLFASALLIACAGTGGDASLPTPGTLSAGPPAATAPNQAVQEGTLGSSPVSQNILPNYKLSLRFLEEGLTEENPLPHHNHYYLPKEAGSFPEKAVIEKVTWTGKTSRESCCQGQYLRVIDYGEYMTPFGVQDPQRATEMLFTDLIQGKVDWEIFQKARYRDFPIGAPDAQGQNLSWGQWPLKPWGLYLFVLLPQGHPAVATETSFSSIQEYRALVDQKTYSHLRALRVIPLPD